MLKNIWELIQLLTQQRNLITNLTKREITTQYVGSLLGFVWTFVHPVVMVCVFWFVFSVGFKSKPLGDVPFVVWLTAGMAPWFFFADVVLGTVGSIVISGHLIKKTIFPSEILPIVRLLSGTVTHGVFVLVLLSLILFQALPVSWYYLQALYYYLAMILFILGITYAVSALNVFVRDTGQMISVVVQVGFWGTPIFWDINMMPAKVQFFIKLNPMYYIVQGYRETFIYFVPFWHHPLLTAYYWIVTLTVFFLGITVFHRLKPQFADAL